MDSTGPARTVGIPNLSQTSPIASHQDQARRTVDSYLDIRLHDITSDVNEYPSRSSATSFAIDVESTVPHKQWPLSLLDRSQDGKHGSKKSMRRGAEEQINKQVVRRLDDCPAGYSRLATFMDSDSHFLMFRRFGYLQTRLLLEKQSLLDELEKELDSIDLALNTNGDEHQSSSARDEQIRTCPQVGRNCREKSEVLKDIETIFHEYSSLLIEAQQMLGFEKPSKREYQLFRTWFYNDHPLDRKEGQWILQKDDMLAIRPEREPDFLERTIECIARLFDCKLVLLTTPEARRQMSQLHVYSYSPERIQGITTAILVFSVAMILVLPILICYLLITNLSSHRAYPGCIAVVLSFTLLFASCAMGFSNAKRVEIIAVTSGYCAVLVVFLGGVGSPS